MASITKTKDGYRVQVYCLKVRDSKTLRTKREAEAWGASRETEIRDNHSKIPSHKYTLRDLLIRYSEEVSPPKRGGTKEVIRINALLRSLPVDLPLVNVTPDVIGMWRDQRLKVVKPGSVLRDFSLLSPIFEVARREWRWIDINPIRDVRKPRAAEHRKVVFSKHQIKRMAASLGYGPSKPIRSVSQSVAVAFLLALRSGMRAGELCKLTWDNVRDGYCILPETKTTSRDVPLSPKAVRLIEKMRGFDDVLVFGIKSQTLDSMFRKYRDRTGLSGFTFHDSRHTAATWLAQKLHIMDLCKMFGWKDPKQAMIYYNPTAKDISKRLA
jgi:integrase